MGKDKDKESKKQKSDKSEKKKKKKDKDHDRENRHSWEFSVYPDSDKNELHAVSGKKSKKESQMLGDKISKKKSKKDKEIVAEGASPRKKHKKDKSTSELQLPVNKLMDIDNVKLQSPITKFLAGNSPLKKFKKDENGPVEKSHSSKSKPKSVAFINEVDSDDSHSDHSEQEDAEDHKEENKHPLTVANDDVYIAEELGWSKEDVLILLSNINKIIPAKDTLKYSSRIEKLPWSEIQFKNYSAEECKEKWKIIEKKVRGFRLLSEMVSDARLWLNKPWSSFYKSQKKNRHPDMPKRPLSSYMLFYMEKKGKISRKNPELGMTDLSKVIADKFHHLSPSKKEKYVSRSKELRDEYNKKMQQFLEAHPNDSIAMAKKKTLKNEMPGPPKPVTPIKIFIQEKLKQYEGNTELSKAEILSEIKGTWKSLSNKKKGPWIRWANDGEAKYLEELEVYKSQNPNFEMPKLKPVLSKEEVSILERLEGKPEKPPNSAYSLFSRLMLQHDEMKLRKFSPKERMREISHLWAAVSDVEKLQYANKAKHLSSVYKMEYATYLESLPEDKRKEELARSQKRKKRKRDPDNNLVKGKKMKQVKIDESFQKKKKEESDDTDDEDGGNALKPQLQAANDESDDSRDSEDDSSDDDHLLSDPQKVQEIKNRISGLMPKQPVAGPFELFKEIFLTNPGNKASKARIMWNAMPQKEQERYEKKLEAQKQNYIYKYKQFLTKLQPSELKVHSMMKKSLTFQNLSSSDEDTSSDEDSHGTSLNIHKKPQIIRNKEPQKTEDSSSSSEDSD